MSGIEDGVASSDDPTLPISEAEVEAMLRATVLGPRDRQACARVVGSIPNSLR